MNINGWPSIAWVLGSTHPKDPKRSSTVFASLIVILVILIVAAAAIAMFALTSKDRSVLLGRPLSMQVHGRVRTYRTVGGGGAKNGRRLVVALHGYGGIGRQFAYFTALHNALGSDTVVAYPDALAKTKGGNKPGWNAQFCCGSGWKSGVDDVAFISSLIKKLSGQLGIEPGRVFIVGFSNGGFMAQRFAVERPDLVSAVAVMSGTIGTKGNVLHPTTPVPMLLAHGVHDQRVRYDGGKSPGDPEFDWLSFAATVHTWKEANGCPQEPGSVVKTSGRITTVYSTCKAPLETIEYLNNKHVWDGWRLANVWTRRPRASVEVARFFDEIERTR